jgi:hypothetical protein
MKYTTQTLGIGQFSRSKPCSILLMHSCCLSRSLHMPDTIQRMPSKTTNTVWLPRLDNKNSRAHEVMFTGRVCCLPSIPIQHTSIPSIPITYTTLDYSLCKRPRLDYKYCMMYWYKHRSIIRTKNSNKNWSRKAQGTWCWRALIHHVLGTYL